MRTLEFNQYTFFPEKDKKRFILLGEEALEQEDFVRSNVMPKIEKKSEVKVPGFWGTLGLEGDNPIPWQGKLHFSKSGNLDSKGVTLEEIQLIYDANPHLAEKGDKVLERFIAFDDLVFDYPKRFNTDDIPKFRLTLMTEQEEGALVYYQLYAKDNPDNDAISYILPENTDPECKVNERDRLTYFFDALPQKVIKAAGRWSRKKFVLSDMDNPIRFVIKILSYKRGRLETSYKAITHQLNNITDKLKERFEKESRLLIFDYSGNDFIETDGGDVDTKKKTLLLLHGTFSTTEGSFKSLYKSSDWLKKIIDKGITQQIIAFDHPTALKDARQNIENLCSYFREDVFEQPVDVIGTSQGGLLAQYLANKKPDNNPFTVGKVALVASANGVDYINTATNLAKFLSILKAITKYSGRGITSFICSIAQHSVKFIIGLPGLDLMKPGGEKLNEIMNNTPDNPNTIYLPIIDDFTKNLVADEKFFKRMAALGLDLITRAIMGKYNDWVVKTQNQFIVPKQYCVIPGYSTKKFKKYIIQAIHGKCLDENECKARLELFLST